MNVLVIGSGGREHALAWKIAKSPRCTKVFIAPGNAGTALVGENVSLNIEDHKAVAKFCKENAIGLAVIGPDDPLAGGIVDSLASAGILAFGPTQAAARLEWSKAFSKDFMKRHNIPTASFASFSSFDEALLYAKAQPLPLVIKADGLALGKGVVIAETFEEAEKTLRSFMVDEAFGDSGKTVVFEEFLEGPEVSVHAFCDGEVAKLFPVARDHKRALDGNMGANTGGMGAIAPVAVPDGFLKEVEEKIVLPVMKGMAEEGAPFKGVLYPGLMVTKGGIRVIEFNARFGDPEAQSFMRILETDLLDIMLDCVEGKLKEREIRWSNSYVCTVALASGGYPGKYTSGFPIKGLDAVADPSTVVFYAGTEKKGETVVTAGGRVLGVSALGTTPEEAKMNAYEGVKSLQFEEMQYRSDIGANWGI
ncbi:MAG: phosphoribosylamine--glycine ligase [Patescibacteria group bacterium]